VPLLTRVRPGRHAAFVALILGFVSRSLFAQASDTSATHPWRWMSSADVTVKSEVETRAGRSQRSFVRLSVGVLRSFWRTSRLEVSYSPDLIPLAVSTGTLVAYREQPCGFFSLCMVPTYATSYGVGISPVAMTVSARVADRVAVSIPIKAGLLLFSDHVPDPAAAKLNFTVEGGVTISYAATRTTEVSLGLARHHTSNGGTRLANPGMNATMVSVGFGRCFPKHCNGR
jgi:hypothetical protein